MSAGTICRKVQFECRRVGGTSGLGECVRMKRLMEMITGRVEFVLLGAALILCLIVVMSGPGEKAEYDTWSVASVTHLKRLFWG